jgi:hypothetical protein
MIPCPGARSALSMQRWMSMKPDGILIESNGQGIVSDVALSLILLKYDPTIATSVIPFVRCV